MACHTLEQLPIFTGDPLDCALKAGALCTIARTEKWRPERGDKIWLINGTSEDQTTASLDASPQDHSKNLSSGERTTTDGMVQVYCEEEGMESLPQSLMKVHGLCRLPRAHASAKCEVCSVNTVAPEAPTGLQHCQKGQYTLVRIPPHCTVNWKRRDDFHQEITTYHSKDGHRERLWAFIKKCFGKESPVKEKPRLADYDIGISAQLSVIKSMIALVQLYSTITILKDNKPKDYGAYQLTLLPYAIMTLVNILSGLFTPSYSSVYMVESTLMKEAENRGGVFEGTVGVLDECEPAILHTTDFEVREVAVSPADGDPHKGEHAVAETALSERGMTNSLPIIRYRHFSLTGGDLIRGYFFYLKRRMPILRLIRNNISHHQPSEGDILGSPASNNGTQNILPNPNHTHISESSESSFWHIFKKRNNPQPAANSNRYYFVFSIGNAKHRACDRR
ncbi:hypothetical protein K440DRAFT_629597 [Wilcoxina mikolae CBS 423.85]|nr:hypothetical protein K440DRAFT_629597 [Wilcoxina mikolae CBS 423.85]